MQRRIASLRQGQQGVAEEARGRVCQRADRRVDGGGRRARPLVPPLSRAMWSPTAHGGPWAPQKSTLNLKLTLKLTSNLEIDLEIDLKSKN